MDRRMGGGCFVKKPMYLVLENGAYFAGSAFGAQADDVVGEVVFTTGMTGYLETLTDPSYYGQMVVQTFPLIGNYGVIPQDFESNGVSLCAYIVRQWCQYPSNFRNGGDIDTFLKERGIPGLAGIDTRALTRMLRENGTLNGMLTAQQPPYAPALLEQVRQHRCRNPIYQVSRAAKEVFVADEAKFHVVLWDFGAKQNMVRALNRRGCTVTVMPAGSTAEAILNEKPDGILLSNGPGDPMENPDIIAQMQKVLTAKLPLFGICMGHQLLALAKGAKTAKLKYGHRGANQPVCDTQTGRVYITSQNHGYAVENDSLPDDAELRFVNLNDRSCEGIVYRDMPAFSVQFHPEACGGPKDTEFLFDQFVSMIDEGRKAKCR